MRWFYCSTKLVEISGKTGKYNRMPESVTNMYTRRLFRYSLKDKPFLFEIEHQTFQSDNFCVISQNGSNLSWDQVFSVMHLDKGSLISHLHMKI